MKIAVASMGTSREALVGVWFGMCSQFIVFDTETREDIVVGVPSCTDTSDDVSLAAIRAVARCGASVVITEHIKEVCRNALFSLGIEVIDGIEGMTVEEAIHRYETTRFETPETRQGFLTKVAIIAEGEGLDATLSVPMLKCTSFIVVDPETEEWERLDLPSEGPPRDVNLKSIRTIVQSGACALITPEIHPECCLALQAFAMAVYEAPEGITVREAIKQYQRGELRETAYAF